MNSNKKSNSAKRVVYSSVDNNKINSKNINKSSINTVLRQKNINSKNLANSSNHNENEYEQSNNKSYQDNFNNLLQSIGNKASMTKYLLTSRAKSKYNKSEEETSVENLAYNHTLTENDDDLSNSDANKYVKNTHEITDKKFDFHEFIKKNKPAIIAVSFILFIVISVCTAIISRNYYKKNKLSAIKASNNSSMLDTLSNNDNINDSSSNFNYDDLIDAASNSRQDNESNNLLLNPNTPIDTNNPLINTQNPLFNKNSNSLTHDERLNKLKLSTSTIPFVTNSISTNTNSNGSTSASNDKDTNSKNNSNSQDNTKKDSQNNNQTNIADNNTSKSNTQNQASNNSHTNTNNSPSYSQSILYNGSSSIGDGRYGWTIGGYNGGSVTSYGGPDSYNITVKQIGTLPWHVQMFQQGLKFQTGKKYRVSFNIRSSISRHIAVLIQETHDQWHSHTEKYYSIPANQTSNICFVTSAITGDPDKFYIGLGKVSGDSFLPQHNITISNLSICAQN